MRPSQCWLLALALAVGAGASVAKAHGRITPDTGPGQAAPQAVASDILSIPGRVIANPRTRVELVASEDGRIEAPPGGFPLPGQPVRTGQLLALLRPAYTQIERRDLGADRAGARRDEYLNKLQLDRYQVDGSRPFDIKLPTVTVQLVADYRSAHAQVSQLGEALSDRIALTAPSNGILLHVFAQSGRILVAGQAVFELDGGSGLAVSANYVDNDLDAAHPAAETLDHRSLSLTYLGSSRDLALRDHLALYRVSDASPLAIGEPVQLRLHRRTVFAASGPSAPP